MKVKKIILFFISFSLCNHAFPHSGGTDSNGCHAGSEPYHCHNTNSSDNGRSSKSISGGEIIAVVAISLGFWCLLKSKNSATSLIDKESNYFRVMPLIKIDAEEIEPIIALEYGF